MFSVIHELIYKNLSSSGKKQMTIDKKSVVPLYYQLAELLRQRISSGQIQKDLPLPSENALMEEYGLSRGTVRQAMQLLTMEKLIVRFPGRGSYIKHQKLEHDANRAIGFFSQIAQEAGRRPAAKVIVKEKSAAPQSVAQTLQIPEGESVLFVQRIRFVDEEPWAIESTYFRDPVADLLMEEDLSNSLYALIQDKNKIRISHSQNTISSAVTDELMAEYLGIRIGEPVLHVMRLVFSENDQPFEYSEDIYRNDRICFKIDTSYLQENLKFNLQINQADVN
jgi:GntR family transcriptional regulator